MSPEGSVAAVVPPEVQEIEAQVGLVLESLRARFGRSELKRIEEAVKLALGHATPTDQAPSQKAQKFHFPGLPASRFFDLNQPGLRDTVEKCRAAASAMREEFLAAQHRGTRMPDYYEGSEAEGREKFHTVQPTQWTTLLLRKGGVKVEPGTSLCPRSTALVDSLEHELFPLAEAFFSVLKPGARLPPHHDNTNAKLNFHVGIIVPDGCGITVGGETRSWKEGECLAFDDSHLHEAWNSSPHQRVVLITDLYRPELTVPERVALKELLALDEKLEPLAEAAARR